MSKSAGTSLAGLWVDDGSHDPLDEEMTAPAANGATGIAGSARRVWVVRAGRGAVYADRFLAEGVVAIGWGDIGNAQGVSWEELSARMHKAFPDDPPVTVGLSTGAVSRLVNEFAIGDFVLTPEQGGTLLAGEITGEYRFLDKPLVEDYAHSRTVRWLGRLQRAQLSRSARNTLGSLMTLFQPGFQEELILAIEPLAPSSAPPTALPAPNKAKPPVAATVSVVPEEPCSPPGPTGSKFETDKVDLLYLLNQIRNRDLALPDFQRSFVWDAGATRELVVSIIRAFPAGNLLFLRGGSAVFLPRSVEEAAPLNGHDPVALVLDGQQRLSSLFQAFSGLGAHRFFVDVAALMKGEDIDTAVKAFSTARAKAWADIGGQARSLMFPLARVGDYSYWRDDILDARVTEDAAARKRLRSYLNAVETAVIAPIRAYQFPVTTLSQDTPTEAVCTIFETLNRTGIKLSVFELICARAFAEGHRLRERWKQAVSEHPILDEFEVDPFYVLQTIALRVGKKPQRGVVAAMDVSTIVAEWDASICGMAQGLGMLRDQCGVLTPKWLPYAPMLPTLAAAWRDVDEAHGAAAGACRLKLQRWFWCASFEGDYDNAPNSRAEADIPLLHAWLVGGDPPPVVRDFAFDPATWLDVTARQRGLYRATMALLLLNQPLDFHHAIPLTRTVIESTAVDDHHIFPAGYLKDIGASSHADTVLNHTLIDKLTNIRLGKKAPSVYLGEMEAELHGALPGMLRSHGLPSDKDGPLWADDYDAFLAWRLAYLTDALNAVTRGATG